MKEHNIELYINEELIELDENVRILLQGTFIDPKGTKDNTVSYSFNFDIPFTENNVRILKYANKDETIDKFDTQFSAILNVDDTTIIDGVMTFSSITESYASVTIGEKGYKAISDIFGEKTFADFGDWRIVFDDFYEEVNYFNTQPNSHIIFPFVMNGLLPKKPNANGTYSGKFVYDDTINLGMGYFTPSFNCMQLLQQVFENQGYQLSGDIFGETRLNAIYQSYKNEDSYTPDYSYGKYGVIEISQKWSNTKNLDTGKDNFELLASLNPNSKAADWAYQTSNILNTDLLSCQNATFSPVDPGNNIVETVETREGVDYKARHIVIPHEGFYKVTLNAEMVLNDTDMKYTQVKRKSLYGVDIQYMSCVFGVPQTNTRYTTNFKDRRSEIKLLRIKADNEYNPTEIDIDRGFYSDAIIQPYAEIKTNDKTFHFPEATKTMFIDPAQDANLVCGVSIGTAYDRKSLLFETDTTISQADKLINPIVMKGGYSGDNTLARDIHQIVAQSDGYVEMQYDADTKTYTRQASDYMKTDLINTDPSENFSSCADDFLSGSGAVQCVVWFDKGDILKVYHSTDYGYNAGARGAYYQDLSYTLKIEPFQKSSDWTKNKLDEDGGTKEGQTLDWMAESDFDSGVLNLREFLPQKMKISEWITALENALNFKIVYSGDRNRYEVYSTARRVYDKNAIDLDKRVAISDRSNEKINLPSSYSVSFSINEDEYGYQEYGTTGEGYFETWNIRGDAKKVNTAFSYCWYKDIAFNTSTVNGTYSIPIISNAEPFVIESSIDYAEHTTPYTDLALRLWYKGGNITLPNVNGRELTVALVSNDIDGLNELTYEDTDNTLYSNFFSPPIQLQTAYTIVKCKLTNDEYTRLPYTLLRLNGQTYMCASILGHDVSMIQEATITLIPYVGRS